jgi:hypothetical protein
MVVTRREAGTEPGLSAGSSSIPPLTCGNVILPLRQSAQSPQDFQERSRSRLESGPPRRVRWHPGCFHFGSEIRVNPRAGWDYARLAADRCVARRLQHLDTNKLERLDTRMAASIADRPHFDPTELESTHRDPRRYEESLSAVPPGDHEGY